MSRNLYKMIARLTPSQRGARQRRLTERANRAEQRHGEDSEQATRAMGRLGAFSAMTTRMEVR